MLFMSSPDEIIRRDTACRDPCIPFSWDPQSESFSLKWKAGAAFLNNAGAAAMIYLYERHNSHCEPYSMLHGGMEGGIEFEEGEGDTQTYCNIKRMTVFALQPHECLPLRSPNSVPQTNHEQLMSVPFAVYSYFATCEWIVVFTNILFHYRYGCKGRCVT
jgi:hypothetical protein